MISELNDFKQKKLAEEREELMKRSKELKKANQKRKKESIAISLDENTSQVVKILSLLKTKY